MTGLAIVTNTILCPSALATNLWRLPRQESDSVYSTIPHPQSVPLALRCKTPPATPHTTKREDSHSRLVFLTSASLSLALKEDLCCWMIPTEYPKVFLFFWSLLFLTEALISIFHILCLPIDSSNLVGATLEKLLSRAKRKKQVSGHFYENQSCSSPAPFHVPLAMPAASPNQAAFQTKTASPVWNKHSMSLWSFFVLQTHLGSGGTSGTQPPPFHGTGLTSISMQDVREGSEQNCSTVNGKAGLKHWVLQRPGDNCNHHKKKKNPHHHTIAVKRDLFPPPPPSPNTQTDITCLAGEAP